MPEVLERIEVLCGPGRTRIMYRTGKPEKSYGCRAAIPMPGIIVPQQVFLTGDDGFGKDDIGRKAFYAKARKVGVSVAGKRYIPSLANHPLDLNAAVSDEEELRAKCRAKGWGLRGRMNMEAEDRAQPIPGIDAPYRVADDILERQVRKVEQETGQRLRGKRRQEVREAVRERVEGEMNAPVPTKDLGDL